MPHRDGNKPVLPRVANSDSTLSGLFRLLSGVGIVPVVALLVSINDGIDQNCDATKDLALVVNAIVKVDNELNKPSNKGLRSLIGKAGKVSC